MVHPYNKQHVKKQQTVYSKYDTKIMQFEKKKSKSIAIDAL
jgi:hypothetical protein